MQLILATDLDGTFLEGSLQLKAQVYPAINALRDHIRLIYTTGRTVKDVQSFCLNGHLPLADFVIADHGTHIVDGENFVEVEALQQPIVAQWNNANAAIKSMLADDAGIELQPYRPPYRVAYYYDPDLLQPVTLEKIIAAGFDPLLSCDMYLDILPRGVNKGSSLLKLLDWFKLPRESTVVCGDSLNDLSLFHTGLEGVAVGNAEPALVEKIQQLPNVYHSPYPGLLGVLDGLKYHQKLSLGLQ